MRKLYKYAIGFIILIGLVYLICYENYSVQEGVTGTIFVISEDTYAYNPSKDIRTEIPKPGKLGRPPLAVESSRTRAWCPTILMVGSCVTLRQAQDDYLTCPDLGCQLFKTLLFSIGRKIEVINMKKSLLIIFFSIFVVGPVSAQRPVSSGPYAIDHPAILWPGSPRTLALGYFNILGDGMHPDFNANPALAADVRGYYFSVGTYINPYPSTIKDFGGEDVYYQVVVGRSITKNASVMFSSTSLNLNYSFLDSEFKSSAFSTSLAYRFDNGILIGMTGTYHKWEQAISNNFVVYSFDAFKLDIGAEVRYAVTIWPDNSNNNSQKFYSKWHLDRVPGINIAAALRNIGSDVDAGLITKIDFPLKLRVGASWLIVHKDEFGVELFGNLISDIASSDDYDKYYFRNMKGFSHSQAIELSFINLLQLRLGHFNLVGSTRALTWGFSVGPAFLKIEYGKIDDFDLFDRYTNFGFNGRDMLTLSFNHSIR